MRSRCVKMRGRAAVAAQRWHLILLWLLVAVVGRAAGAGNPVNAAAQEGRAHHIDLDSVGAWESLSRCEWAPLCPSLLLVISLAGGNEQERLELQVRTPRSTRRAATQRCKCRSPVCVCRRLVRSILPASFTGVRLSACCISLRYEAPLAAIGGVLAAPFHERVVQDSELVTRLLGHIPSFDHLPMSVVFRRGIVLLHTADTPTTSFLEQQLGLPSHEHGASVAAFQFEFGCSKNACWLMCLMAKNQDVKTCDVGV